MESHKVYNLIFVNFIFLTCFLCDRTSSLHSNQLRSKTKQRRSAEVGSSIPMSVSEIGTSLSDAEIKDVYEMIDYCSCRCCTTPQDSCTKYDSIPANFTCPSHFCRSHVFHSCEKWEDTKLCKRACFCQKCQYKLGEDDIICKAEGSSIIKSSKCSCHNDENIHDNVCQESQKATLHDALHLQLAFYLAGDASKCPTACFCSECDISVLERLFSKAEAKALCSEFENDFPLICMGTCHDRCPTFNELSVTKNQNLGQQQQQTNVIQE